MKKIVLIACGSKKMPYKAKAKNLYAGVLFTKRLQYAHSLQPDKIFILSAKYGLLELDDEIEPYNVMLKKASMAQLKDWAGKVIKQLEMKTNLQKDHFTFLTGKEYQKYLVPHLMFYSIPLKNARWGNQLHALSQRYGQFELAQ